MAEFILAMLGIGLGIWPHGKALGSAGVPPTNKELREDGSAELREDGGIELRE